MSCESPLRKVGSGLVGYKDNVFDPNRIENPVLARVIREHVYDGQKFLFGYDDHSDYKKSEQHSEYNDAYSDHVDHTDHHSDKVGKHTDKSVSEWGGSYAGRYEGHKDEAPHKDSHTDKAK